MAGVASATEAPVGSGAEVVGADSVVADLEVARAVATGAAV